MRIPKAMQVMIGEVSAVCEDAMMETQAPDGFNVWRVLVLDLETTKAFVPLIEVLDDQRILDHFLLDNRLAIRFVADRRADDPKAFGLDRAFRVLQG